MEFSDALEWAQWTRKLAFAAIDSDSEKVCRLASQIESTNVLILLRAFRKSRAELITDN